LCWSLWTRNDSPSGFIIGSRSAAPDDRLSDLDLDVKGVVRYEKLLALFSSGDTVFSGDCVGLDANPDDDGGDGLDDNADLNKVHACPLHTHGMENVVDVDSKLVLPDLPQGVVADGPKLLERKVHLGVGGQLPSIGARASHEEEAEETRSEAIDAEQAVDSVDWVCRKGNMDVGIEVGIVCAGVDDSSG
jgi:hypothetical protein